LKLDKEWLINILDDHAVRRPDLIFDKIIGPLSNLSAPNTFVQNNLNFLHKLGYVKPKLLAGLQNYKMLIMGFILGILIGLNFAKHFSSIYWPKDLFPKLEISMDKSINLEVEE
jgi:hypothetical protein